MKNHILYVILICMLSISACQTPATTSQVDSSPNMETASNEAAPGFDLENSDPKAMAIADEVMEAMGGRPNWDQTDHIRWNFFGRRSLVWSKKTGNVRIEIPGQATTILMNIHTGEGRVMRAGEEITEADSLAKELQKGESIWINDSYWLIMPYKLKDSGVTLSYLGEDTTQVGAKADVLQLRFKKVGLTPQNRYLVYVDKDSRRVSQWVFFRNAEDTEPLFSTPWANYQQHGHIMLSGDRGETPKGKRELTEIAVYDTLPTNVYESFEAIDFSK